MLDVFVMIGGVLGVLLIICFSFLFCTWIIWKVAKNEKIDSFCCRVMGWHSPVGPTGFDGCSIRRRCSSCKKYLMMDSQGNWF